MSEELSLAIQQICEEKGLSLESVKETIEEALAAAYRKDFGNKRTQNIKVKFDLSTGNFEVFDVKEVVKDELKEKYEQMKEEIEKLKKEGKKVSEEMLREMQGKREIKKEDKKTAITENSEKAQGTQKKSKGSQRDSGSSVIAGETLDEEKRFNPRTMISLSDARKEDKKLKVGDQFVRQLEVPADFGRMAAQTAKQVIIQKLREAERDTLYNQYKEKVGELIVGTIQRQEGRVVLVDLGNITALMLPIDQLRTEKYNPGVRMKFYLKSVEQTSKGPEVNVSRSHPELLRKLFKLEVPEINAGTVQIKSIARDPGFRSKIAVWAKEENLDPIGACIGQRGTRVQTVINELGGEKIDIIEWDEDDEKFIINALAPAKVLKVELNKKDKTAKAYVKEDQYSLAIGKEGQNVRLAAQLTGWKVDVVMEKDEDETQAAVDSADEDKGNGKDKSKVSENGKTANIEDSEKSTENSE